MSKIQTVQKVADKAASTPVPVPVVSEVQAGVQIFLELEPYAQKAVLALIHHFHKGKPPTAAEPPTTEPTFGNPPGRA